jgi:hypothetical protein
MREARSIRIDLNTALRHSLALRRFAVAGALIAIVCFAPSVAWANGQASHDDPIAAVALWLAMILVTAKLGGDLAVRAGQPAVLGELVGGIVLGNVSLVGIPAFANIKADPSLEMLARIGALILLFEVGLESTVAEMLDVGTSAMLVAIAGVVAPFALGWGVGAWLLPEHSPYVHAFLGATLSATSVGITARVLKDLGRSQSPEARIILGQLASQRSHRDRLARPAHSRRLECVPICVSDGCRMRSVSSLPLHALRARSLRLRPRGGAPTSRREC